MPKEQGRTLVLHKVRLTRLGWGGGLGKSEREQLQQGMGKEWHGYAAKPSSPQPSPSPWRLAIPMSSLAWTRVVYAAAPVLGLRGTPSCRVGVSSGRKVGVWAVGTPVKGFHAVKVGRRSGSARLRRK